MKTSTLLLGAMVAAPLALAAQGRAPVGWSVEGRARLDVMYSDARARDLPTEPMRRRVSEGEAKGASETTILTSVGHLKANLEASHQAMVSSGRRNPAPEETSRGASAMERGVTKVQIEQIARSAPNDRSLVVAFDVLTQLAARGVPVARAVAQVQGKLDARATDRAISALVPPATGQAGAGATVRAGAGAGVGTAVGGARPTGWPTGVTGAVAGTVTGVVKRP